MSDTNTTNIELSPGLPAILFVLFLTLKLCSVIDWSWWWVTCPLWAVPALLIGFVVSAGLLLAIGALLAGAGALVVMAWDKVTK